MSLNKSNLAIVITLALGCTAAEFDATIDQAREALGFNGESISPTEAAAASAPLGAGRPSVEAMAAAGPMPADRDANGLPWDQRIHSTSKNKNADGSWRLRKGVDKGLVARIEAELKSTSAAVPSAAPVSAPPLPLPVAAPSIPLPPLPVAAVPANPVFTNFVSFLAQHTKSEANPGGRLTDEWVKQFLAGNGVAGGELQNLAANTALIPPMEAALKGALGIA